jgi:hypothetical protein
MSPRKSFRSSKKSPKSSLRLSHKSVHLSSPKGRFSRFKGLFNRSNAKTLGKGLGGTFLAGLLAKKGYDKFKSKMNNSSELKSSEFGRKKHKRKLNKWQSFVKKHKNIKRADGRIDLKRIASLYKQ